MLWGFIPAPGLPATCVCAAAAVCMSTHGLVAHRSAPVDPAQHAAKHVNTAAVSAALGRIGPVTASALLATESVRLFNVKGPALALWGADFWGVRSCKDKVQNVTPQGYSYQVGSTNQPRPGGPFKVPRCQDCICAM